MKMQFPASLEIFASKKELSEFLLDGPLLQKITVAERGQKHSFDLNNAFL